MDRRKFMTGTAGAIVAGAVTSPLAAVVGVDLSRAVIGMDFAAPYPAITVAWAMSPRLMLNHVALVASARHHDWTTPPEKEST